MKKLYPLIILSFLYSGCSLIYSYSDNLPQRIDSWTKEKKYHLALNTINYIKPDHKNYKTLQNKKNIILKQAAAYENEAIEKSSRLANQGEWIQALNYIDEVKKNLPDTTNIDKHRNELLEKRKVIISDYEYEMLNTQAKTLAEKINFYNKIKRIVSTKEINDLDISKFDRLLYQTIIKLSERAESQYKASQYDKALESIDLALMLNPTDDIVIKLDKIKHKIKNNTRLKTLAYINSVKDLLNKLSQGYSYAILKEAKEKITWLNKNKDNKTSYQDFISRLENHLKTGLKQHFQAGRNLYSKGKTQEALSIWLEIKDIEPNYPKLQSHISRAEKVLNKLEKLSNKPAGKK